ILRMCRSGHDRRRACVKNAVTAAYRGFFIDRIAETEARRKVITVSWLKARIVTRRQQGRIRILDRWFRDHLIIVPKTELERQLAAGAPVVLAKDPVFLVVRMGRSSRSSGTRKILTIRRWKYACHTGQVIRQLCITTSEPVTSTKQTREEIENAIEQHVDAIL